MKKRILFLCAQHSIRSHMAESILIAKGGYEQWDVWSSPVHGKQERTLAQQALAEIGIPLQETPQTTQPYFGLSWDKGVILCSGMADT
jgi:protein-tyrosine-phosphatase